MDLIGDDPVLNLRDRNFRIYSKNQARAPQFLGSGAVVENSMISEGCRIYGTVINSILSGGVVIEAGACVRDSVIMDDVVIKSNAEVYTAIIDADVTVLPGATVGSPSSDKNDITVIAKGSVVSPSAKEI